MAKWIEILKTGTFTAKNGKKVTITGNDLDAIQTSNPAKDRTSPLVFGHPEDDQPAFGWLEAIKRKGNILLASFTDVPDVVKNLVKDGYYKKVSVSLMPDKKTLRHVGLLGAVQPAVPGLKDVSFSGDDDQLIFEFSTGEPDRDPDEPNYNQPEKEAIDMDAKELQKKLDAEKAAREAAEAKLKTAETEAKTAKDELSASKESAVKSAIETRVNDLVGKKILAKDKPLVEKVALALGGSEEIELSEGAGKKSLQDHMFDFLSGLPDLGLEMEFSSPDTDDDDKGVNADLTGCV